MPGRPPSAPSPEAAGAASPPQACLFFPLPSPAIVRLQGKDRADFLHRLTTNDLLGAAAGQGRTTAFLNTRGRVVDLSLVLARQEDLLLLPSPGNAEKIRAFLDGFLFREEVTLTAEEKLAGALLFGGNAKTTLERATSESWESGDLGDHRPCRIGGSEGLAARILPMPGDAFLLVFAPGELPGVESALLQLGAARAGESAMESARVQAMIPGLGHELSEEFNPWEVSLDRAIHLQKGCYLGQEVVARLHTYRKVQRRLVGLELSGPPTQLPAPLFAGSDSAGTLTSAAPATTGDGWYGLAVIRVALGRPGLELRASAPDSPASCRVRPDPPPLAEFLAGPS